MGDVRVDVTLGIRAHHPEGPLWDAATARLWWVDIVGERVHCFDPPSGENRSWHTPGQPGGVVLGVSGEPVVAPPRAWPCSTRTQRLPSSGSGSSRTSPRTAPTTSR